MDFSKELINYMELLECSTNELAKESTLSYALLNKYINNTRTPKKDSESLNSLVDGIYKISLKKDIKLSKDSIYKTLENSILSKDNNIDYDSFIENFNKIQYELSLSSSDLAKALGYDASFVSRLKNKERRPANLEDFINKLADHIVIVCTNEQKKNLSHMFNCPINSIEDNGDFKENFINWICSKHIDNTSNEDVFNFLTKLDTFDLNDYIDTNFDKVKLPTVPVIFKNSKVFYGIEGRKQAEAEFLKTTLLSKSNEPIFFYTDLPISETGNDNDFKQKWIFAMTALLKKGLHLNMVHNLDRPTNEMLLGLENWIPIYMSGSISPYYFKVPPSNLFTGHHCTSGTIALSSECINHNEKKAKFYLTTKQEELDFEKEKTKYLLSKATPLMEIYKEKDKEKFEEFMNSQKDSNIQTIKKDIFKNIDFCINEDKWIMINKQINPEIHFVIYHKKLINAIKTFLLS